MKRTLVLFLSTLLVIVTAVNFSACTMRISAENLMDGITARSVFGMEADEDFKMSQTELALKLFKSAVADSEGECVLISPLSVQLALAMTANGADGETKREMEALLADGKSIEELNRYLYSYVSSLPESEKYKLKIANSIWFNSSEERISVNKNFLQTNANYYGASAYASDFDKRTVRDINNWVNINTDGMIDEILKDIDSNAVMYLINALAFDAEWHTVYEKTDVFDGKFTNSDGKTESVEMMRSGENRYIECSGAKGFFKDYKDRKYSFVALLPEEGVSLHEYIDTLTAEELFSAMQNTESKAIVATMPKFSYEYCIKMNDCLKGLGIEAAFDVNSANFSGIGSSSDGNLYIGNVLHKTYISVDERGTRAAAVTKVELECGSAGPIDDVVYINLDRPFVYMIVDNVTNLPLFIGTVTSVNG